LRISTADICDRCSDQPDAGLQVALPGLQPFGGTDHVSGPAATLACEDDNALLREIAGTPGLGRVLVIDGRGSTRRALLGDIQASRAMKNGWAGIIVHGYVRDRLSLAQLPFPVFALGTVPLRPLKNRTGETGGELKFLNITIRPGMWIYADPDGMIVLNRAIEIPAPAASTRDATIEMPQDISEDQR